jgi:hypothetical protein
MIIFIALGNINGNAKFVDSINAVIASPRGFSDMTDLALQVADSAINVSLKTVDEVIAVNRTVSAAVDFQAIDGDLGCIENMLLSLPNTTVVKVELQLLQTGLDLLPSEAEFSRIVAEELTTPFGEAQTELAAMQSTLSGTSAALQAVIDTSVLDALSTEFASFVSCICPRRPGGG